MDSNKMTMLKDNVKMQDYISISDIKMKYNVSGKEAEEMLNELINSGLAEPFSFDGAHFKVKK